MASAAHPIESRKEIDVITLSDGEPTRNHTVVFALEQEATKWGLCAESGIIGRVHNPKFSRRDVSSIRRHEQVWIGDLL